MLIVNCPTCQRPVEWVATNIHRPFCCKRCQLVDLGEWASENHVISQPSSAELNNNKEMDIEEIEAMLSRNQDNFFKE